MAGRTPIVSFAALGGICTGFAWWFPGKPECALLGWLAVLFLVLTALFAKRRYSALYLSGLLANLIGFYWLKDTISDFGGFSPLPAYAIFLLYLVLSALQFPIFALFYRFLPRIIRSAGIGTACAWVLSEIISVRIFPWHMGHTQLAFTPFAQAADLGGSLLLSFIMFWLAESLVRICFNRESKKALWAAPVVFLLCLIYGFWSYQAISKLISKSPDTQQVALVQANVSIKQKHNTNYLEINTKEYSTLSRQALDKGTDPLLIWPESSYMQLVDSTVNNARFDPKLPFFEDKASFLIGAISYDRSADGMRAENFYNSAVAVYPDGTVPIPYHKIILMPFGEYMPFASIFPALKNLNPVMGDFTPGNSIKIFKFPFKGSKERTSLKVAPLICYEDVVQGLSQEAVRNGAEILVNLTNDAWFGDTIAPYQHNLIASFRALENRRFLLRSTNTGLTSVVDPLGRTLKSLPPYSSGVLFHKVAPLTYQSPYTFFLTNRAWWIFLLICACLIAFRKVINNLY